MRKKTLIILFAFSGLFIKNLAAQGNLIISPNRVVFDGRKQKEELNLINAGDETASYSVSFVQRRMKEDGSFEIIEVPDEGQYFADSYLRIYPRQITLGPGEAQVVVVQCLRKPDMKDGEYRSHLYFRLEKDSAPRDDESRGNNNALSVQITPIFGMSIPIIIRSGKVNAITTLTDLKLENKEGSYLTLALNRTGNISVYGDLHVDFIPKQGKPIEIGVMKGVAVYTNITRRNVSIALTTPTGLMLHNGKLKVRYTSRDDARKQEVFAEAEFQL